MASTITDRIDGVTASLAVKTPVKAATTAAIALEGEQAIDGVSVTAGDRVLVKDQANPVENGIYNANTGAWTRARDFDGARDAVTGTLVVVASGDTSAGYWYQLATADPVIIGTSAISFIPVPPTHGLARVSEVVLFSDGTDWFVETPDGVPVDISSSTTGGIQEAFDYARDNGFGLHVTKGPTITMTGTLTLQSFEHMTVRIDANITSAAQYGIVFDDFLHSFIEFTGVFMFSGSAGAAIHIAPSTGNKNALDSSIYFQRVLATGGSGSVGLLFSPLDAASCQRTKYAFGEMEGGAGTTAYWANLVKVLNPTNGGVFRSNRVEFVGPGLIWSSAALQVVDSDSPSSLQYNYWSGAFFTSASATAFIDTRETGGQYRCDLVSSSAGVTTGIKTRIGANDNVFQFQMNIAATPVDFSVTGSAVGNLVIGPPLYFRAQNGSGNLALTNATETPVTFNVEALDAGDNFNISTDIYTVPYTCLMRVEGGAEFLVDAPADCYVGIKVNSSVIAKSSRTISANKAESINVSRMQVLTGGDTIQLVAYASGGTSTRCLTSAPLGQIEGIA